MTSIAKELGDNLLAAIEDRRDATPAKLWPPESRWSGQAGYVHSGWQSQFTWYPISSLIQHGPGGALQNGKVYIVGSTHDNLVATTRTRNFTAVTGVQVAFQTLVKSLKDDAELDSYVEFVDQLIETARLEAPNRETYQFTRIEFLTDDNGTPMNFLGLREEQTFEAYFTAYYNVLFK